MVSGQGRMFHGLAAVVTSHRQASGSPFSKAQSAMGVTALPPKNCRAVVPNILCFASPQLLFRPRRSALRLCLPLRLRLANMVRALLPDLAPSSPGIRLCFLRLLQCSSAICRFQPNVGAS